MVLQGYLFMKNVNIYLTGIIGYTVLLCGCLIMGFVIYRNYESPIILFPQLLFAMWNITPNVAFFLTKHLIKSWTGLLLLAFIICGLQILTVVEYFSSTSSTSALIFIFAPFYEILVAGIVFLIIILLQKRKARLKKYTVDEL